MDNQKRGALEVFDSNKGNAPFEREEVILRDTNFFDVSTAVTDMNFFNSKGNDSMYQNAVFPITSHAYRFTHARISHTMDFTVASPVLHNVYAKYFDEYSFIEFQKENRILGGPFSIATLKGQEWINAAKIVTPATDTQSKDKFNSWYKFVIPIEVGAGKQFEVRMKAAKGLTTSALVATATPYYPNVYTTTFTTATRGFGIKLELKGIRWIESGS